MKTLFEEYNIPQNREKGEMIKLFIELGGKERDLKEAIHNACMFIDHDVSILGVNLNILHFEDVETLYVKIDGVLRGEIHLRTCKKGDFGSILKNFIKPEHKEFLAKIIIENLGENNEKM